MRASFTQNPDSSYRAVPHGQEDAHTENYPLTDYQLSTGSNVHYSADGSHIPATSWDSNPGSATKVGPVVNVVRTATHKSSGPDSYSGTTPTWLPYTLRWRTLASIIVFTAVLEIVVIIVHALSARQKGLLADDGSASVNILTKLIPTLLAVVHGILLTMLLNDVKRTQPYANLASPSGASAGQSLTWIADAWWECLMASMPKRNIKRTNWAMLCTSVAFIFSFLIMSPFSSTLLVSQDVLFVKERAFSQLDISSALPLRADALGTTYFRTVGSLLQNATTSAWISDRRAVLPFWPSTIGSAPLGPILSDSAQTWSAKTTVFDVEIECQQMNLVDFAYLDWDDPEFKTTVPAHTAKLTSPSGCSLDLIIASGDEFAAVGGASWSDPRQTNRTTLGLDFKSPFDLSGCNQDEIILLSGPVSQATPANATLTGQICRTSYFMGEPSVTVTLSKSATSVVIDESEYSAIRQLIPSTVADLPSFQRVFLNNTNWSTHLVKPKGSQRAFAFGPAFMLSALYDFDSAQMVADSSLLQNAGRVKQRFFGELLRDVFDTASGSAAIKTTGTTTDTRRRVVVVSAVAIILEVFLFLQLVLLSAVLVTTRISRRPLGLFADPAPPIRVAKLISNEPDTLQSLDSLHGTSSRELEVALSDKRYMLSEGHIHLVSPEGSGRLTDMSTSQKLQAPQPGSLTSTHTEKQSYTFSLWMFIVLIFLLSAVLIVIAYLYWYADAVGLYQTAFVYAFDISVGGLDLGDVNPASLLTTLVAVIIGLWWGSLDTALRRIQPYLILAKRPITKSRSQGVLISYVSSYLLLAAWRALKHTHWVLALVCTGAFLSEIRMFFD